MAPGPPNAPPVEFPVVENIDARKGFACGARPVACGRRPTPSEDVPIPDDDGWAEKPGKPVGCEPSAEPGFEEGGDVTGVDGAEGMGGSDSSKAAPNEEEGLNALRPLNPVVCGRRGAPPAEDMEMEGALLREVAPVGCEEREEKRESENVEPDVVLEVGWAVSGGENEEPG